MIRIAQYKGKSLTSKLIKFVALVDAGLDSANGGMY